MHLQDVRKSGCPRRERDRKKKRLKETLFPRLEKALAASGGVISSFPNEVKQVNRISFYFVVALC